MCAGLGIAILVSLLLHRALYPGALPPSVPTPPVSAVGFVACGLALIGVGFWVPRVTSMLAMVALSMAVAMAAERAFGLGPRVETLVAANLGASEWNTIAPNTLIVLLLAAGALMMRHTPLWFEARLGAIAVLGSIIFAIGVVACVGYMTDVPIYTWQSHAPMSFWSAICSSVLGLGILMSACRYNDLDSSGIPRWFSLAVCTGALAVSVSTGVAYLCGNGQTWEPAKMIGLLPMMIVSWMLAALAGRQTRRSDA
jgi:hypothetical protein